MRREHWICVFGIAVVVLASLAMAFGQDLDLPVEKPGPKPAAQAKTKPPEPPVEQVDEKPPTLYGSEVPSESQTVVFVLDDSGSMENDWNPTDGNRLDRAKRELKDAIEALPPNWKFDVVVFDCGVWSWQPGLVPASRGNKTDAQTFVTRIEVAGGTGTAAGCTYALALDRKNRLVVLLTDGAPTCSYDPEEHRKQIRAANSQGARIDVFGISCDNEMMRTFCREVASDNNGTFHEVR